MFVTWREIHQPRGSGERERVDYAGIVNVSLGLLCATLSRSIRAWTGASDWRILACLGIAAVLIAVFPFVERARVTARSSQGT